MLAFGRRGSSPRLATQVSARKKILPASPELDMFKFPGDQESHLGQLAGEKSEPADQFSPKESFASSPLDLAFAAVASKLQTLRPAPSPQVTPLSKQDAELIAEAFLDLAAQKGATNKFHCEDLAIKVPRSPAAEASTLDDGLLWQLATPRNRSGERSDKKFQ